MTHRVQYVPLASIKFAAKNPKKHDLDEITESFKRLGFGEPPLLDERTKRLVAGHGRVEALRGLKAKKLMPPLGVHIQGKDWLVPVVRGWRSKNDAAAEAYLVGSNHLVELGGWDDGALAKMLSGLAKKAQLVGTGWDANEVDRLVAGLTLPEVVAGGVDPSAEWQGMPEFDQQDKTAFRSLVVHLKTQADVDAFAALVGQGITEKTRFLWYPSIEIETYADKAYVPE